MSSEVARSIGMQVAENKIGKRSQAGGKVACKLGAQVRMSATRAMLLMVLVVVGRARQMKYDDAPPAGSLFRHSRK
jgi:hypothetical protein